MVKPLYDECGDTLNVQVRHSSFRHSVISSPHWRARRRYHLAMLLSAIVVVILSWALSFHGAGRLTLPGLGAALPNLCAWRHLTGIDCPGCGLTRSFVALAHGNLAQAWHFNPAGLLWFAAVVWQIPYRVWQLRLLSQGRELMVQPRVTIGVVLALAAACVLQWGVRFWVR